MNNQMQIVLVGNICPTKTRANPNQGRVYSPCGIAPCLNCTEGGNRMPHIVIGSTQSNAFVGDGGICCTLTEAMGKGGGQIPMIDENNVAVRRLTPKECFRLMGFEDSDIDILISNGISNTQLYKMAGNSIVVTMLEFIFCEMFDSENEIWV